MSKKIVIFQKKLGEIFIKEGLISEKKLEIATSLVRISIPTTKKACEIEAETIRIMTPLKDKIYTITSDNGLAPKGHFLRAVF